MLCFDNIPEGLNGFITIILSLVTFVLSTVAVSECKFLRVKDTTVPEIPTVSYFGLFYKYVEDKGCEELVFSGSVPAPVRSARAFGVLASMFAAAILAVLLFQICVAFSKSLRLSIALVYGICFTFQMLTFTVFAYTDLCDKEKITCDLGPDGYTSLMAAVFQIICVVVLCMVPDQKEPIFKSIFKTFQALEANGPVKSTDNSIPMSKNKTVTVTECLDADGNKTTTKVTNDVDESGNKTTTTETTNPDGSVIVTKETNMA